MITRKDLHDWDKNTHRCKLCGVHETKAVNLVWGCSKAKANERNRARRKVRKGLPE